MKNFKILLSFLMVLSTAMVMAADEQRQLKAVPGAALYVYSINSTLRPAPDAEPITVIVDNSSSFKNNLNNNPETRNLADQDVFMVWKGYIAIPAEGTYTFSASFDSRSHGYANNVIVQLNGKDFLSISHIKQQIKMNDSRSVTLEKGDYEITIIYRAIMYGSFSLRMWDKSNPLKKINITPAALVHAE